MGLRWGGFGDIPVQLMVHSPRIGLDGDAHSDMLDSRPLSLDP